MMGVGDRLPDGSFRIKDGDGKVAEVDTDALFAGQKVVLVGLPGAFTSTCHLSHVPQFLANVDALKKRGVGRIAVLAVNDHHVMRAWAEVLDAADKVDFLADPVGDFTRAIGMEVDMTAGGLGPRCRRFTAIIDDRMVRTVNVEAEGTRGVEATSAATILTQL